jgi:hypothetical protein
LLVPRSSSTSVAAWTWPTWVVSRRRVLEAVFVLLESLSPSRKIFIGSHSLPPSLVRRIGPSSATPRSDAAPAPAARRRCQTRAAWHETLTPCRRALDAVTSRSHPPASPAPRARARGLARKTPLDRALLGAESPSAGASAAPRPPTDWLPEQARPRHW